jgi:hypothetical protein
MLKVNLKRRDRIRWKNAIKVDKLKKYAVTVWTGHIWIVGGTNKIL